MYILFEYIKYDIKEVASFLMPEQYGFLKVDIIGSDRYILNSIEILSL